MTSDFTMGLLIGMCAAILLVPMMVMFLFIVGALWELFTDPKGLSVRLKGTLAAAVFALTPGSWVWMSSRYKRRQWYERWRARSIDLEKEYTARQFERVREIQRSHS